MSNGNDLEKMAAFISKVVKDPKKLANLMYGIYDAMTEAGFDEEQAIDITKWLTTILLGMGGA